MRRRFLSIVTDKNPFFNGKVKMQKRRHFVTMSMVRASLEAYIVLLPESHTHKRKKESI